MKEIENIAIMILKTGILSRLVTKVLPRDPSFEKYILNIIQLSTKLGKFYNF